MATLLPFRALRPPAGLAARVASPPYDVVSTQEARSLARGNADSFLRVSRPEIDLPEGIDEHADAVYAKGRENLAELVRRGVLVADAQPRPYVYAQRMGEHRQAGLWPAPRSTSESTGGRAPTRRTTGSATSTRSRLTTSRCS